MGMINPENCEKQHMGSLPHSLSYIQAYFSCPVPGLLVPTKIMNESIKDNQWFSAHFREKVKRQEKNTL